MCIDCDWQGCVVVWVFCDMIVFVFVMGLKIMLWVLCVMWCDCVCVFVMWLQLPCIHVCCLPTQIIPRKQISAFGDEHTDTCLFDERCRFSVWFFLLSFCFHYFLIPHHHNIHITHYTLQTSHTPYTSHVHHTSYIIHITHHTHHTSYTSYTSYTSHITHIPRII